MSIFEQLRAGIDCASVESTIELGRRLVEMIPHNQVLALQGDLGAGKTTLTKGIGAALGIEPAVITSPTFNLYAIYKGDRQLIHIDGYRLERGNATDELLIEEFIQDPWLIVVEWPERGLADWMLPYVWKLSLNRDALSEGLKVQLLDHPAS